MAGRIRSNKPEIFEDAETATLSDAAFRLYQGMVSQADDWGNGRAVAAQLGGFVFWAQKKPPNVDALLEEMERKKVIRRYEADGLPYFSIVGWNDPGHPRYQNIDRKSKTRRVAAPPTDAQPYLPIAGTRETLASGSRGSRDCLGASSISTAETLGDGSDPIRTDPKGSDPSLARACAIPVLVPPRPEDIPVDANGHVTPEAIREETARALASMRGNRSPL